jgi:flagellar biosynthesis anti-sigma factor FlgM
MKVNNSKDNVELSTTARSSRAKRAEAAAAQAQAAEANPMAAAAKAGAGGAASVELSSDAKVLSRGVEAARTADITDKDKIAMIKAKLKDGTYNPDYGEVADRMLNDSILNS